VTALCLSGCSNKNSEDTQTPGGDAAAADGGDAAGQSSRARGGIASGAGGEKRVPKMKLKASSPVRAARLVTGGGGDGGGDGGGKTIIKGKSVKGGGGGGKLEVSGFAPTAASPGASVEVFGSGFSGAAGDYKVTVGGVGWIVDEVHADRLTVTIPEGAKDGKLTVKKGKKKIKADANFVALTDDGAFGKPGPVYNGLLGEVFIVGEEVSTMPDFSALGDPTALLSAGPLDIAETNFEQGLPGPDGRASTNFAIRYTGSLNVTEEAEYDLCLTSDDGSRLFLEDTLVVDNDGAHAASEKCELVYLEPGEYQLRVEYFQGASATVALQLSWSKDGADKAVIPANVLFRPRDPSALLP
jgi:hypothetical protein